ncbi:hypothetical protein R3P82_12635 [Dietzia maris]|uniref:Uncharacterized protein n=1 Tax=Dietzia maris TaxID=37915 RepID=A0AAE4QX43_9ACTN|nr:hypothetical protein [Dietzia maris]MDV6299956.1 hypothetical protein [Dietzia maris]
MSATKVIRVITAEGIEYVQSATSFDIQQGVLILFSDRSENVAIKAYNVHRWGDVEWVDPSEVPS